MNKIYFIGGDKGGVGKSFLTLFVLDILKNIDKQKLLFIESDDTNPDVYKSVNKTINTKLCNLDTTEGYEGLSLLVEDHQDHAIVINSAARAMQRFVDHSEVLIDVIQATNRKMIMFWPINTDKDSLELLLGYLEKCRDYGPTYVVLNTYFGKPNQFNMYYESGIDKQVAGTIVLPLLSNIVTKIMSKERIPPWGDSQSFKITHKSVLCRFRDSAKMALKDALYA